MTRLQLTFECQGQKCGATLDSAAGTTGLLIVSGGNEVRAGAFNGQSHLAAGIAEAGFPVFRFDRRGIGDSEGENRGYVKSRKDIAAALLAFRAIAPRVDRVVGFGNCDAASALMLFAGEGFDALVLANPWTMEGDTKGRHLPSSIRARYAAKLRDPEERRRLLGGKIKLASLVTGLVQAVKPNPGPTGLAQRMADGLSTFLGPVDILLASADRTAQSFEDSWDKADTRISRCPGADHAFSGDTGQKWLRERLLRALQR